MNGFPFDPADLPKGMELPAGTYEEGEARERVSLADTNYAGMILNALKTVEGLEIRILKTEITEDMHMNPVMSLVLEVVAKE